MKTETLPAFNNDQSFYIPPNPVSENVGQPSEEFWATLPLNQELKGETPEQQVYNKRRGLDFSQRVKPKITETTWKLSDKEAVSKELDTLASEKNRTLAAYVNRFGQEHVSPHIVLEIEDERKTQESDSRLEKSVSQVFIEGVDHALSAVNRDPKRRQEAVDNFYMRLKQGMGEQVVFFAPKKLESPKPISVPNAWSLVSVGINPTERHKVSVSADLNDI